MLVHVDDYSAFDADTGQPLWRLPKLDDRNTYVGYNLELATSATTMVATNVTTGKVAWTTQLATNATVFSEDDAYSARIQIVGSSYWVFGVHGYDVFDLLTGKQTDHAIYPANWVTPVATTTNVATEVDGSVRLFPLTNWSTPLWSVTASASTRISVVTKDAVIVTAPAGLLTAQRQRRVAAAWPIPRRNRRFRV